jgi:uncharacterized protein YgbK (DUF1537 family)
MSKVHSTELFASLPPPWPDDPIPQIREALAQANKKVVVLDDDPTGTQTVHDIPVLTEWTAEALQVELANDLPAFYILTNSRSLSLAQAQALNSEIGRNLIEAARRGERAFVVVSRSDSTLRGHFPGEVQALADALGGEFDGWLLIPFFEGGGRYTLHDVHYVSDGEWLVPAGETEFAQDAVFGYRASNLRAWVEEKTRGRIRADTVDAISIAEIRQGGPVRVAEHLQQLEQGRICVVNAASQRDIETFTVGLLKAEAAGKRFLYRTAASFVPARAGLEPRPLLAPGELDLPPQGGGLIVVGSYMPKTTVQVNHLLEQTDVVAVEVNVAMLLANDQRGQEIGRVAQQVDAALRQGRDVVVFTSRRLVTGADAESSLAIGQRISHSLIEIVRSISVRPRYLLAKGGITSSDIATRGLRIKRALVLGQIAPGVPVWQAGPKSRYPGLAYIVFPGNVGGPQTVAEIVTALKVQ